MCAGLIYSFCSGCSIPVVRALRVRKDRVRFPASRPKRINFSGALRLTVVPHFGMKADKDWARFLVYPVVSTK